AETVRTLLDSNGPVDVADMSRRLGYELDREHVAFLVWTDDDAEDELFAERERVAAAVAASLGAPGVLSVARGRALACWAAASPDAPRSYTPRHPLRVALGTRLAGVDGFRRSHVEAQLARRVAAQAVTWFADVSLDALMTHDLDEARRFVAAELGP